MSKKINVNPDHYKVAGRERQGEDILSAMHKQAYTQQSAVSRWASRRERESAQPSAAAVSARIEGEPPRGKTSYRGKARSRARARGSAGKLRSTKRRVGRKIAKPRKKESRERTKPAKR